LRRRKWLIKRDTASKRHYAGLTAPTPKQIVIYDKAQKRKRSDLEKQKTFWHELTHAVLMTMDHKLKYDEPFVTQFSLLLEEAIRTARFEETTT
jgi:hypothetical protein